MFFPLSRLVLSLYPNIKFGQRKTKMKMILTESYWEDVGMYLEIASQPIWEDGGN